jgi:hypothetical protein
MRWSATVIRHLALPGLASTVLVASAVVPGAPPASASWLAQGNGFGAGAATTMPAGGQPEVTAVGGTVSLKWDTAELSNGQLVAGYLINRYDAASHALQSIGPGCAGVVTATSCLEDSVPPGTWVYTDTPVLFSWRGAESPASSPAAVPATTPSARTVPATGSAPAP